MSVLRNVCYWHEASGPAGIAASNSRSIAENVASALIAKLIL